MPIAQDFDYHRPSTLKEAGRLLGKYKRASILAGGTDLIAEIKEEAASPDAVIDIKAIVGLNKIAIKDGKLRIGALVTFADIIASKAIRKKLPVLVEISRRVASPGIRNRATLAGNICSAVPCLDSGPLLMALDAVVVAYGPSGQRKIPVSSWFRGNRKTSIKRGEIVTEMVLPLPPIKHGGCFIKLGRYNGEDLAQASVLAMAFAKNSYRVAFGSLGPVPLRAHKIEDILNGKTLSDELIEKSKAIIPGIISPISDIRASKEYRLHMAIVMFERAIRAAVSRLSGDGPEYGTNLI